MRFWGVLFSPIRAWWRWAGRRQTTLGKVLAYGAPFALLLVIIIASVAGGGEDGDTGQVAVQPTEVAGRVTEPTQAPEPTATPEPPAATPTATPQLTPTAIPEPSPTPTPGLTAEEQAYLAEITEQAETVGDALTRLGELLQNPFEDDAWVIDVAVQVATIRLGFDEAIELDAPQRFSQAHTEYQVALSSFDLAMDMLTRGLDNLDEDLISEATVQIEIGGENLQRALALFEAALP